MKLKKEAFGPPVATSMTADNGDDDDDDDLLCLSGDGLDLSEVATVGPCGHQLPLRVAIEAVTTATATTTTMATKTMTMATGGCPKCRQEQVHMIADNDRGPTANAFTSIQSITDGLAGKGRPHVTFRYKNCLFSLGVVVGAVGVGDPKEENKQQMPMPMQPWTAQGRIVQALGLASVKVLCRGKVVYPHKTLSEEEVSKLLLEISRADRSAAAGSCDQPRRPSSKVSLLVMGTAAGRELAAAPDDGDAAANSRTDNKGKGGAPGSSAWSGWWSAALGWAGYLAQQSGSAAWALLVTTLSVIHAGCAMARDLFLLTATSANNNNNNNNGTRPPAAASTSSTTTTSTARAPRHR